MDLPVMKYLAESMRNTADALLETMRDGKTFVCDECFGGNFEACEANEPNAIRMVAGGKESWWCCGYCRLKLKNAGLENGYRDWETDRKSTRLNSSHSRASRMPSSA